MTDQENGPEKPILDGLKDADPKAWKAAWEKAKREDEQREAWIRERVSRAPKPGR